jgi:exonuclease III
MSHEQLLINCIKVLSLNVQGGIRNKIEEIIRAAEQKKTHIICLQETKMHKDEWNFIQRETDWKIFHSSRTKEETKARGTAILVHKEIAPYCSQIPTPDILRSNLTLMKLCPGKQHNPILILNAYGPNQKKDNNSFFKEVVL